MLRFFRKIRHRLLEDGRLGRYALYALGEIALVVIGILIALQINNANERRVERLKELNYLQNLRTDLVINIQELEASMAARSDRTASALKVLAYFEGKPLEDLEDFNYHNINTQIWQKFYHNSNTFQELVNSGNLAIISDEAIKTSLMDIELLYQKMKSDEEHSRFDFEEWVYRPFFDTVDIAPMTQSFAYRATGGQSGARTELSRADIDLLLQDTQFKNGFSLAVYMNNLLNTHQANIKARTAGLVRLIDREITGQLPDPQAVFFERISSLCGSRFSGQSSFPEDPGDAFRDKTLVAHIADCGVDEIRIPFRVGDDESRTWILRRVAGGLQLKHDHRHEDGTPDEVTMYGGTSRSTGSELGQSFPADAHTASLIPDAATNEWFLSLSEDGNQLTYTLERHGQPRFRAVLSKDTAAIK